VQRCASVISQPGGKGSNAARVYRQLGGEVFVTGFVGRDGGQVLEPLRGLGIHAEAVEAYDSCRICTTILDPAASVHPTVINEESSEIEDGAAGRLLELVENWLPRGKALLITGSPARGLAPEFYRIVLERAKARGLLTMIDAAGEPLVEGLRAGPDILKLNIHEFSQLLGKASGNVDNLISALKSEGIRLPERTIITLGELGAVLRTPDAIWHAAPPQVFDTNPIGAGDAFAAGYIFEALRSGDHILAFKLALAAAAADAATANPGHIDQAVVDHLRLAVSPTQI
jgi:1-phosphofructokinase family hexose kinase